MRLAAQPIARDSSKGPAARSRRTQRRPAARICSGKRLPAAVMLKAHPQAHQVVAIPKQAAFLAKLPLKVSHVCQKAGTQQVKWLAAGTVIAVLLRLRNTKDHHQTERGGRFSAGGLDCGMLSLAAAVNPMILVSQQPVQADTWPVQSRAACMRRTFRSHQSGERLKVRC